MKMIDYVNFEDQLLPIKKAVCDEILLIMKRYTNGSIDFIGDSPFLNNNGVLYSLKSASLSYKDEINVKIQKYSKSDEDDSHVNLNILINDLPTVIKFYNFLFDRVASILFETNLGKVFLGGSCGKTIWRKALIPHLEKQAIPYFNPQIEDWNEDAYKAELVEKMYAAKLLFVLSPRTENLYTSFEIANLIRDDRDVIVVMIENDENVKAPDQMIRTFNAMKTDMQRYKNASFTVFESFNDEAIDFIINKIIE